MNYHYKNSAREHFMHAGHVKDYTNTNQGRLMYIIIIFVLSVSNFFHPNKLMQSNRTVGWPK